MATAKRTQQSKRESENIDLLVSFLTAINSHAEIIHEESLSLVRAKKDTISELALDSSCLAFKDQFQKMGNFMTLHAEKLSPEQRQELNLMLQHQSAQGMIASGSNVYKSSLRSGVGGKILKWLFRHLQELKKILRAIIQLICRLLHINYPTWIEDLFQFINELGGIIFELIEEILGGDSELLAKQLTSSEVNYYNELAASQRLKNLNRNIFEKEE